MKVMKSMLVVACAIVGISVMAGAFDAKEYKTYKDKLTAGGVSWAKGDATVAQECLKYADSVDSFKSDAEKYQVLYLYGMSTGYVAKDFAELQKAVDAKIATLKFEKPLTGGQRLNAMNAWFRAGTEQATDQAKFQWSKDVYAFMKTVEGYETWGNAGNYAGKLGNYQEAYDLYTSAKMCPDRCIQIACEKLNAPAKGLEALNDLATGNVRKDYEYRTDVVKNALSATAKYLLVSDEVKAEDLKSALTKMNRKYSFMLAKDKAKWEPIIAQIRLMLSSL